MQQKEYTKKDMIDDTNHAIIVVKQALDAVVRANEVLHDLGFTRLGGANGIESRLITLHRSLAQLEGSQ